MNKIKKEAHLKFQVKTKQAQLHLKQEVIQKQTQLLDEYRSRIQHLERVNDRLRKQNADLLSQKKRK